jgi:hypothetical protein
MNLFLLFDGTWKGSQEHTNSYRCHLSLGDHTKDRGRQVRAMEKQIDDLSWGFELYESFTLKHNIAFTLKNAGHILESTYGDRNHENRSDRQATLANTLDHALSDNGIVYIPAFALGRTQELIYELDRINPGQSRHSPVVRILGPCRPANPVRLGDIHAGTAGRNPAGAWGAGSSKSSQIKT